MKNTTRVLYKSEDDVRDKDIVAVLNYLNELMNAGRFRRVDTLFKTLDVRKMSVVMMIAAIRTTFMARSQLISWKPLLNEMYSELERRNRDPDKVLQGLLSHR